MDVCIMRNYGNYFPREQLRFEHAVIMLREHKDDLFLNVMDKYQRYSAHVTVLVSCKKGRKGTFYKNNMYAQYFSAAIRESVQFIPSAREYIEKNYTAKYRPSITVTDDLNSESYLPKYCPQYYNYASNHFYQLNVSDNIQGLNLAHPIDLSRFDHQLSLFTCNYLRHKVCIKTIIQILPPCFIFFAAFGDYKSPFHFQEVINAFILFKHKYDKYLGHEIMLILGGEYFQTGSDDCKYRRYLRNSLESVKKDHNVIFLKRAINQAEKKTLLRLSYAAFYLEEHPNFDDVRFTMSLGTPIICSSSGYVSNMVIHGVSGFKVDPERVDHIAGCMETLSIPSMFHRFSTATRNIYLKHYSEMSMFLQTVSIREIPDFNRPDMAFNPALFCNPTAITHHIAQSVKSFDLQNDWFVSNEYSEDKHPSVFEEGAARIEYENHMAFCQMQLPQRKEFIVNEENDLSFDTDLLPKWSEEDDVCDQMFGEHLFEVEDTEAVSIRDPALPVEYNNDTVFNPRPGPSNARYDRNPFVQPFQLQPIVPPPPSEPFQQIPSFEQPPFQRIEPQTSFVTNKSPFMGMCKFPGIEQQQPQFVQNQPPYVGHQQSQFVPNHQPSQFVPNQQPSQLIPNQQPAQFIPNQQQFSGMYNPPGNEQPSTSRPNMQPYQIPIFKPHEPPPPLFQLPRIDPHTSQIKLNQAPYVDLFQAQQRIEQRSSQLPIQPPRMAQPSHIKENPFPDSPRIEPTPLNYNLKQFQPFQSSYIEPKLRPMAQNQSSFGERTERQQATASTSANTFSCIEPTPLPVPPNNSSFFEPYQSPRTEQQHRRLLKETLETPRSEQQPSTSIQGPRCESPFSYFSKPNQSGSAEPYQHPPYKTYQSPFDQLYEPPSLASIFGSASGPKQSTSSGSRNTNLLFKSEPEDKENVQPLKNQSLLQRVKLPLQDVSNQALEQRQNQIIEPFPTKEMEEQKNMILKFQEQQMRQKQNEEMSQRAVQPLQIFRDEPLLQHPNKLIQQLANESTQLPQSQRMELLNQSLQQLLNQTVQQREQQQSLSMQQGANKQQTEQGQQMQQLQTQQMLQSQDQQMQNTQRQPLQQLQNKHLQQQQLQKILNQPMPQLLTLQERIDQAIEQHRKEVAQQQLNQQPLQQSSNQDVATNQPVQLNTEMQQQMQKPQLDTLQQRLDLAIQMQRKELMQQYQQPQMHPNQSLQLPPNHVIQPFPNLQPPVSEKVFQAFPPMMQLNQSPQQQFRAVHSFPNQPSQVMPNLRIQPQQVLPNQPIQPPQVMPNQPTHVVYLNNSTPPPQILANQGTQPPQILQKQPNQVPQLLPNQPFIMLNPSMPNQHIQPTQAMPNQLIQPTQMMLNQPIQQPQLMANQPIQPSQVMLNQPTQSPQVVQNQPIQPPQNVPLQAMPNQQLQPLQAMPNQQPVRPFFVGIMKQYPPQIMPMHPRPQFIAPNQPTVWVPIPPPLIKPPVTEAQSSASEYSTPRQFFEPEGATIEEIEDSDANDVYEEPSQRWEEVFASDSVDNFSVHGSDLSETREESWSGICSDDSAGSCNKSWRVFNTSYQSTSQISDDMWQEGNPESSGEDGVQQLKASDDETPANVVVEEEASAEPEDECRECRDEKRVEILNAKVNAKLESNKGVDTKFHTVSKATKRKAKKRRMKKIHAESSD